ncbi:MAG: hypothetical protein M1817_000765 [Caeruleum heppii]|nr:MAG: hypothetical protein M1817_000765 [Caeruleum heppii]
MSSTTDQDPFLQVQADVLDALTTVRPLFTSYLRIRALPPPSSPSPSTTGPSPELVHARQELEATLQDLSSDLRDLVESVHAVEGDPYRYGLDVAEVARRRRLVEEVGGEIEDMRDELAKTIAGADRKARHATSDTLPSPTAFEGGGDGEDGYAAFEQERQIEMMHEQDEALDDVFQTVGNLRHQADEMGRELEEQGGMLNEIDGLADRVGGRLQTGLKKMGTVIKKNEDGMSSCCIVLLISVLIILLILVLVI